MLRFVTATYTPRERPYTFGGRSPPDRRLGLRTISNTSCSLSIPSVAKPVANGADALLRAFSFPSGTLVSHFKITFARRARIEHALDCLSATDFHPRLMVQRAKTAVLC